MARGKGTKARRDMAKAASSDGDQTETHKQVRLPEPTAELPRAFPRPLAAGLVFIAAGAVLMLEILAVRLLAPYVGLTLETTTSIIGAALAGIATGAAVGGYLADRTDTRLLIVGLLIGGGLLTLLTVPIVRWLGPGAQGSGDLAALGITLLALVPAAAVLSAVSPAVAHLQLHDLRVSGTVVGSLSAWATAGALIGTFGTGFVVVPLMPVSSAVLVIGLVLILVGVALGTITRLLPSAAVAGVIAAALAFGALSQASDGPCLRESKYHCLDVEAEPGSPSGHLLLDGVYNSYVDVDDPTHLEYAYTQWIADAIDATNPGQQPLDVVFVGGGGLTLPRWLLETRPGSRAQVLEVDGEIVDFVEDRFGIAESQDLRVTVGDARMTMRDLESDSADVVVGDAFSGYTVPWHLTTTAWLEEVKRVLDADGTYTLNMIDEGPLDLIEAEAATLLEVFPYVRVVARPGEDGSPFGGNFVFIASERRLGNSVGSGAEGAVTYNQSAVDELADRAEPLRDDYAPVDQLRTENY
jgi:hypothetical protein